MPEEILKKTGKDLFRELLRAYNTADIEDYYKGGVWKDELMRTDLQLIMSHRREAGAPDLPPLEEVEMPELPTTVLSGPGGVVLPALRAGVRPVLPAVAAATAARPATALRPITTIAATPGVLRLANVAGTAKVATAPVATAALGGVGPAAELRLIAIFVAKWKLDPTRAKTILAKLTPQRRRYVIQNFKTAVTGPAATSALEQYIAQCERTGAWGSITLGTPVAAVRPLAARPATAPATQPVRTLAGVAARPITTLAAGIKRPISVVAANTAVDPSKRPRLAMTASTTSLTSVTPRPAVTRPTVTTPRPAGVYPTTGRPAAIAASIYSRIRAPTPTATTIRLGTVGPKAGAAPGTLIRNLLNRY